MGFAALGSGRPFCILLCFSLLYYTKNYRVCGSWSGAPPFFWPAPPPMGQNEYELCPLGMLRTKKKLWVPVWAIFILFRLECWSRGGGPNPTHQRSADATDSVGNMVRTCFSFAMGAWCRGCGVHTENLGKTLGKLPRIVPRFWVSSPHFYCFLSTVENEWDKMNTIFVPWSIHLLIRLASPTTHGTK